MKNSSLVQLSLAAMLCTSLLFSCTTDIEPPPPQDPSSSSADESSNLCVYAETRQCFSTPQNTCPAGGELSTFCPFPTQSSSSLAEVPSGSSSSQGEQSNSSNGGTEPEYGYCVFSADRTCFSGTLTVCPPGGALSNSCPYSSSGGVAASSSSGMSLPSSSGGSVKSSESQGAGQVEGNVFTDPRDGKKYKFEIASSGKIWMSENLNYSRNSTLGYCYGVDINGANPHRDSTSCGSGYGRIYDYATATDGNLPQGLCPNGWHIPSTAEWNNIVGSGARKMSVDFYIYPGNYNLNTKYPPVGWKDRDTSGFYWTSSGNGYFTGFWEGRSCKSGSCLVEAQTGASATDRFSVRCVANDDFKLSCGTGSYAPATQFCSGSTVYTLCGGKSYNPSTQFCSGTGVYVLCGGSEYDPATEFCSVSEVYAKCSGMEYNPEKLECIDGALRSKAGNQQITCTNRLQPTNCGGSNDVTLEIYECVEIRVLEYTEKSYLPNLAMRCEIQGTQPNVSVTMALNGKATTAIGNGYYVETTISLGKIELGDNEFGSLCVTALSGATSVKCNLR